MNHDAISPSFDPGELIQVDVDVLREDFRALRRRGRMSQAEVAGLLKVSQATISAFEQGKHHRIRPKTLRGLADIVALWKHKGGGEAQKSNSNLLQRHATNSGTADHCPQCGVLTSSLHASVPFCPSCGRRVLYSEDEYCSRCGAPLTRLDVPVADKGDADVRLGILKNVLGWIEREDSLEQLVHELSRLTLSAEDRPPRGGDR